MTFHKCQKCKHQSMKVVDESSIVGTIQCVKGEKSLMNRRQYGTKCILCGYSNLKIEVIDSKGHRVA